MSDSLDNVESVLAALKEKGVVWSSSRPMRDFLNDSIRCVGLVQTDDGVIRAQLEYSKNDMIEIAKAEVKAYLGDAKIDERGEFAFGKHPKEDTAKIFEYESRVRFKYSRWFGWRPITAVPAQHAQIKQFCDQCVVALDSQREKEAADEKEKAEREKKEKVARANRALLS
jgi:hypothetical protein